VGSTTTFSEGGRAGYWTGTDSAKEGKELVVEFGGPGSLGMSRSNGSSRWRAPPLVTIPRRHEQRRRRR